MLGAQKGQEFSFKNRIIRKNSSISKRHKTALQKTIFKIQALFLNKVYLFAFVLLTLKILVGYQAEVSQSTSLLTDIRGAADKQFYKKTTSG